MEIELKQYGSIPDHIKRKAWREIHLLKADKSHLIKWKALRCKKGGYRLKLNRNYRLVAIIEHWDMGTYEVMNHAIFDRKY